MSLWGRWCLWLLVVLEGEMVLAWMSRTAMRKTLRSQMVGTKFGFHFTRELRLEAVEHQAVLSDLRSRIERNLRSSTMNLGHLKEEQRDLEAKIECPGFWDDSVSAQAVAHRLSSVKVAQERAANWQRLTDDIDGLNQFAAEDPANKQSYSNEIETIIRSLSSDLDSFDTEQLLGQPHDNRSCMLSIQCGLGGQDAQDWTAILLRMYMRYAERKGFHAILEEEQTGEAGLKSALLRIDGPFAYGLLSGEKGIHRLVRISPFNALSKRQTSFASVETWPVLDEQQEIVVDIPEKDLEVTSMRAGGKGGQNVNKVETAVRIKHIPSGLTVRCEAQRSQAQNKQTAIRLLKSKLLAILQEQALEDLMQLRGSHVEATFGQQSRSYVFAPYKLIKDSRSGHETSLVQSVLDGDLDAFLSANLRRRKDKIVP